MSGWVGIKKPGPIVPGLFFEKEIVAAWLYCSIPALWLHELAHILACFALRPFGIKIKQVAISVYLSRDPNKHNVQGAVFFTHHKAPRWAVVAVAIAAPFFGSICFCLAWHFGQFSICAYLLIFSKYLWPSKTDFNLVRMAKQQKSPA